MTTERISAAGFDLAQVDLGGHAVTNIGHDPVDLGAVGTAVGARERVERDLASRVFAGGHAAVVGGERVPGSEPEARKDLDRFEDGEGQGRTDEQAEHDAEPLQPARKDERLFSENGPVPSIGAMRRIWWIPIIAAGLAFLYLTALPGDLAVGRDDEDDITGTYTVNGVNPFGEEYSGTAVIVRNEVGYDIEWIVTGVIQRGTAQLDGVTLTAEWEATSSATGGSGRSVYTVEADGSIIGQRFVDGIDGAGSEELFPEA